MREGSRQTPGANAAIVIYPHPILSLLAAARRLVGTVGDLEIRMGCAGSRQTVTNQMRIWAVGNLIFDVGSTSMLSPERFFRSHLDLSVAHQSQRNRL